MTSVQTNGTRPFDFTTFSNVINGKLVGTQETRHGINPSTLEPLPEVPLSTLEDVDRAVEAATVAAELWSDTPIEERREAVTKLASAVASHQDEFTQLLVKEQGKPVPMAAFEVSATIGTLNGYAALPFADQTIEDSEKKKIYTQYTPLGVVVGIVPWNFPLALAATKIASALVTGNVIILKPSPFTPYVGLKLVELAQSYLPPGVVQVLSGDDRLGPWLTSHPGVDKVSFTGSTATGKKVMESCSKTLKRVTLELGGNDPAIICEDVDVKEVAAKVATLAFINSGQVCIAIKRVYVHDSIYPQFLDAIAESARNFLVGDGFKENIFLGPIQNSMQYERVKGFLADIEAEKQKTVIGGPWNPENGKGYFINPTIVDNPPEDSRIVVEEPFGPIVPILRWTDEKDVLRRANNTPMGLGASIWTKDIDRAAKMAQKIKSGSVWINTHADILPYVPFGGHKHSGMGFEGSTDGLKSYCNVKVFNISKE